MGEEAAGVRQGKRLRCGGQAGLVAADELRAEEHPPIPWHPLPREPGALCRHQDDGWRIGARCHAEEQEGPDEGGDADGIGCCRRPLVHEQSWSGLQRSQHTQDSAR